MSIDFLGEMPYDNRFTSKQYSSDDTQEHLTHSKHKHKSNSRDEGNSGSRHREHREQENNDGGANDRHKISSKHSKDERHHRSRYLFIHIDSNKVYVIFMSHRSLDISMVHNVKLTYYFPTSDMRFI